MKKIYFGILILAVGFVSIITLTKATPKQIPSKANEPVQSASPVPSEPKSIIVTPFSEGSEISLIANYKQKKTSEEIQKQFVCDYLSNGGFYTKEENPVGYVKTATEELGKVHDSLLFDGFISVNEMETVRITRKFPSDALSLVLQTGPILIENFKVLRLSINNDKEARRVFALVNGENKILFGLVHSSTLEELPVKISKWAKDNSIIVADAINLDGGSASAFRGPNGIFPEISPIGSAFCIKIK